MRPHASRERKGRVCPKRVSAVRSESFSPHNGGSFTPLVVALRVSTQDPTCDFLEMRESCRRGRLQEPALSRISLNSGGTFLSLDLDDRDDTLSEKAAL